MDSQLALQRQAQLLTDIAYEPIAPIVVLKGPARDLSRLVPATKAYKIISKEEAEKRLGRQLPNTKQYKGMPPIKGMCGPAAIYHTLQLFGKKISYVKVMAKAKRYDVDLQSGTTGDEMQKILNAFGYKVEETKVTTPAQLKAICIKKKGIAICSVSEWEWDDETGRPYDIDGHWAPAVFDINNIYLINSSFRTDGIGNLTYGVELIGEGNKLNDPNHPFMKTFEEYYYSDSTQLKGNLLEPPFAVYKGHALLVSKGVI